MPVTRIGFEGRSDVPAPEGQAIVRSKGSGREGEAMPELRQVRVLPTDGRWCMWTENGEMEWFAQETAAIQTAMRWAYKHRPAEAVLEEPGHCQRVLCCYADPPPFGDGHNGAAPLTSN